MTQKNGQEPKNLKWMEIAESDAVNEVRHSRSRLPYVAAAFALVAVGGGAIFAQSNPLEPAQVEPTSVVASVATALPTTMQQPADQQPVVQGATNTPPVVVNGIPTIPPVAGGGGYDEDDDDDDHDDNDDHEDEDEDND
jgi:hypothetical protein